MTMPASSAGSPADVPEYPRLYWVLQCLGAVFVIVLLVLAYSLWSSEFYEVSKELKLTVGPWSTLLAGAYIGLSVKRVAADEVAGAYFWGRALVRLSPALQFVPFGLMQIERVTRIVQQFQAPGEPEKVFKGDDKDLLPPGMVRPIRTVTRAPNTDSTKGPVETELLDVQMTLTQNFVTQYVIDDIFDFIANFGTVEVINTQLRDTGEATLSERTTKETPRTFIENLTDINEKLVDAVRARFLNTGVRIMSVRLISPDLSHGVSEVLAEIPKARATAQVTVTTAEAAARATVIAAEAQKTRLTREGEGAAAATLADRLANAKGERARLAAKAAGGKQLMKDLKLKDDGGAAVLAAEAVRDIAKETDVIIAGAEGGMADLMGLVKGVQAGLNPGKGDVKP